MAGAAPIGWQVPLLNVLLRFAVIIDCMACIVVQKTFYLSPPLRPFSRLGVRLAKDMLLYVDFHMFGIASGRKQAREVFKKLLGGHSSVLT